MARLPKRYVRFFEEFPEVGKAYENYGESVANAGPLDEKTRCLIKLAMSFGSRLEGGAKSHAHKALLAGATADELRHAALLAAPTLGFPHMMACLSWVEAVLDDEKS